MIDRRLVQHFDWVLLGLTVILGAIGILALYSTVSADADMAGSGRVVYLKQLYWFGIGLAFMVVMFLFNYRRLNQWASAIYTFSIILLVCVIFLGKEVSGSKRWLMLGSFSFQPSELTKIAIVVMLARYFSDRISEKGFTLKRLWKPLIWMFIPFALIAKQPDLGTSLIVVLTAATMIMFSKIERRSLICLIATGALSCSVAWFFLKGYQKKRILAFLSPGTDPLGAGYHIIQSKIAVGSGMLFGKGFLKGTQNVLSFLPEQHTDFVFSVLAEQWGFIGSAVVVALYLSLVIWGLGIAISSKEPFGTMLAVGITSIIFWQVFINIGMTLGLLPVVGVPLPLISYGGSSLVSTMIGVGLLANISMRRFLFKN
ncbi:MAG: rod shape-determining protein RodA [Deltaproteobacteria bacterium]|nr:MAG: rod shape-determining protein RodA [Deltaproteobacteria bacterium]RLB94948.1 MAG: rod shape-determining protein RodA [Deltaproteobacteria bacterium]